MGSIDRQGSTPQLLNRLRMRQIALILAIREHRTLRGAAAHLGLSQPAATKMLHELEDALNIRLFQRVGRGLQLNDAGERVTAYFEDLRGSMEALNRELGELRQGSAGRLAVGSIMAASPGRLTQALLDLYTIKEKKGTLEGLAVTIVGDILHSRVARSNIYGLSKFGCDIRVVGPSTLMAPEIEKLGVKCYYDLEKAVAGADVVNILRIQKERQHSGLFPTLDEYANLYMIKKDKLKKAKEDVLILHPGPMNRGVEISSEIADGTQALINEQVTNGVAVRMALLFLMMGGTRDEITN